jgi:hypothetical protein
VSADAVAEQQQRSLLQNRFDRQHVFRLALAPLFRSHPRRRAPLLFSKLRLIRGKHFNPSQMANFHSNSAGGAHENTSHDFLLVGVIANVIGLRSPSLLREALQE